MPNLVPPPAPIQVQVLDTGGLMSKPWINWATKLGQLFGYNQTIQAAGTAVPQEAALNFLAPFIVTDNPTNGSTDISTAATPAILQGTAMSPITGNERTSMPVVFATDFISAPRVFLNPSDYPRAGENQPMSWYATNITKNGFIANGTCAVPVGGGGGTFDQSIPVQWLAIL